MRRSQGLGLVVCFCLSCGLFEGCGNGDALWVTGVLVKEGQPYKPPSGRKLSLYFCPMSDGTAGKPPGDTQMADYNEQDGSFKVPGTEGNGIRPGKYRIALVETFRRETIDQLEKVKKPKKGKARIDREKNLLEETFGETTSPFVRDLKTSTHLTLDMARPTG